MENALSTSPLILRTKSILLVFLSEISCVQNYGQLYTIPQGAVSSENSPDTSRLPRKFGEIWCSSGHRFFPFPSGLLCQSQRQYLAMNKMHTGTLSMGPLDSAPLESLQQKSFTILISMTCVHFGQFHPQNLVSMSYFMTSYIFKTVLSFLLVILLQMVQQSWCVCVYSISSGELNNGEALILFLRTFSPQ